jgi:hypothetical protein
VGHSQQQGLEYESHSRHQLKLAIRRDETDRPRRIKLIQPYALVESTVIELYGVNCASLTLVDY